LLHHTPVEKEAIAGKKEKKGGEGKKEKNEIAIVFLSRSESSPLETHEGKEGEEKTFSERKKGEGGSE